jgi:hypothetical protein
MYTIFPSRAGRNLCGEELTLEELNFPWGA